MVIFIAFFRLLDPKSEKKNPVNQLIINSGYDKNGRKMSQPQTADYPSTSKERDRKPATAGYDKNGRKMSQPQTADHPSTSKGRDIEHSQPQHNDNKNNQLSLPQKKRLLY